VKSIALLIALISPAHAGLIATFQTTQGDVVVELQHAAAPQAVANFITLAEGTRAWIDPRDGRIRKAPFYDGIKIHRTSNTSNFKFAQGGSPTGDGSDGPGYTFKDEFDSPLTHVPYVLSMANAGPNTNGSQFFFTGSVSQPTFDNVHTIFGLVTDPASRSVVDAMIAAGKNATTINQINIARTDAAAQAFDEHAQNLPVVFQPGGHVTVIPGVSAIWNLHPPMTTGDVFHAFRSTTLAPQSWQEIASAERHVGISTAFLTPVVVSTALDNAANPSAFYQLSVASHPGSVAPSDLANRTMVIEIGADQFSYEFNPQGSGGFLTIMYESGVEEQYPFTVIDFLSGAHNLVAVVENVGLASQYRYFRIKVGCDTATSSQINGRHATDTYNPLFPWIPFEAGLAAISR
jgi:peptidyl-prolyl cis-trans isomerase A (cyclophilin A)